MTPTPEQNAKRETPRTDAAIVQAGDCYKTAEVVHADLARTLETELTDKHKIIENHCQDWAEDDTAIKELCKRCGVADVHPIGDDFKSCVECVEELAHKFIELRQAADGMAEAAKEAAGSVLNAIHFDEPEHVRNELERAAGKLLDGIAAYRALAGEGK